MRRILFPAAALLLLLSSLAAVSPQQTTPYWVDDNGAATWAGCRSSTPLSGASACSLATANANAAAGDLIYLRSGEYTSSYISPANSGTADASYSCSEYITYQAAAGETPVITGGQTYGALLNSTTCIKLSGITFGAHGNSNRLTYWILFENNADRNHVFNCTFVNARNYGGIFLDGNSGSVYHEYNVFESNNFPDVASNPVIECGRTTTAPDTCGGFPHAATDNCNTCPADHIMAEDCRHCLFIYNTFGDSSHSSLNMRGRASWNVVRYNTFSNKLHSAFNPYLNSGVVPNILTEENTFINTAVLHGTNPVKESREKEDWGHSTVQGGYQGSITRKNLFYNNYTSLFARGPTIGTGDTFQTTHNRVYHNTMYRLYFGPGGGWSQSDVLHNILKNNIVYGSIQSVEWYPGPNGTMSDNTITYNDFYSADLNRYRTTNNKNTSQMQAMYPSEWFDNIVPPVNPNFRNTANNDFRLAEGSPLIDAATHLTLTTNSAATPSTQLRVADSYYFYSKETWQTPNHSAIASDYIYVNNTGLAPDFIVQITWVNRSTNILTLASPKTWEDNAKVYLAVSPNVGYYGSGPDIGAFEYASQPTCPNGNCDQGESCTSCPQDCPCASGICCSGTCQVPICSQASQCGTDPCRTYTCSNPGTCSATCASVPKTACTNSDGCCPPGCTSQTDPDCAPAQQTGLCSGLKLLYRFDNNTAIDSSGNSNHGTPSGPTWTASGRLGGAFQFDGADDFMATSDFIGTGPATACAWIYPRSFGEGGFGRMVHNGKYSLIISDNSDNLDFTSNGYANHSWSAAGSISLNAWQHVCASREASGSAALYVNGAARTVSSASGTPQAGTSLLYIGNEQSNSRTFNGTIDELSIWNRSLSATEIQSLYQRTLPLYCIQGDFHRSDTQSPYGCIQQPELSAFIALWNYDSTAYPMRELMDGIGKWKAGSGC